MSFINLIVDSLACLAAIVVLSILGVLLGVLLCKLKNIVKDKVEITIRFLMKSLYSQTPKQTKRIMQVKD